MNITALPFFIKSHIAELTLLSLALLITIFSATSYLPGQTDAEEPQVLSAVAEPLEKATPAVSKIVVDVSGAVLKPDVYEVTQGARLADVIKHAGGLEDDADSGYIARNFNMARFVVEQEKIYIPFKKDIASGMFTEAPRALDYLNSGDTAGAGEQQVQSDSIASALLISINTASKDELDMLPGVGPTTAQKIIDSRPYESTEELLAKKAVSQSVFDKIKDLISL